MTPSTRDSRADASLPQDYGAALLQIHDKKPFPNTPREIAETAGEVTDDNFRIEVADDGIHVYNRQGHHVEQDAFALFEKLGWVWKVRWPRPERLETLRAT